MKLHLCIGLCLLVPGTVLADIEVGPMPREVQTSFEIPYKLTDTKHILIRIKLNGKGPFNFILDTGAPAMIMSEKIAEKTGVQLDKGGWGEFPLDLEGGLKLEKAKGLSTDMFQLKGMNAMGLAGVELHGVLGYNILAQFRIQYDFTKDKLIWTPLKFNPPPIERIGKKGDGQGGLEMVGDMMKMLAPLMGIQPNFEIKSRGFVGIEVEEKEDQLFVKAILPESPAAKTTLKPGDRILKARGRLIDNTEDLMRAMAKLGAGDKLTLQIKRGEETQEIIVELGKGL